MSRFKLREVSPALLRRLAALPMAPWEVQDARMVAMKRCQLSPIERWDPRCYLNNRYVVQVSYATTTIGEVTHLWIRTLVGDMPRSWRDLQTIKEQIVGPHRVAVEVFPAIGELVDQADMAHLWVYPEDTVLPFGLRP